MINKTSVLDLLSLRCPSDTQVESREVGSSEGFAKYKGGVSSLGTYHVTGRVSLDREEMVSQMQSLGCSTLEVVETKGNCWRLERRNREDVTDCAFQGTQLGEESAGMPDVAYM